MKKRRPRSVDTPDHILTAARELLRREGATRFTIDAVAAEAGISKGGVMHHYPTKDALITQLVAHKLVDLHASLLEKDAALKACPNRHLLAFVRHARDMYCDEDGFPRSLLVASAETPAALEGFRTLLTAKLAEVRAESPASHLGVVLTFATLGLLLTKTLGLSDLPADEAEGIFDAVESLAT